MGRTSGTVVHRHEAVQLQQGQGADQPLLPIAQRAEFLLEGRKKATLKNLPEGCDLVE